MTIPIASHLAPLAASVSHEVVRFWDIPEDRMSWYGNVAAYLGTDPDDQPRTQEAFLGRIHPDHRERVCQRFLHWLESDGDTWSVEFAFYNRSGEWIDVHEEGRLIRDEDGGPKAVVASLLDVGRRGSSGAKDREDREDRGVREHDIYRALAEHASDIITVMLPDGEIRYESPSVERVLGYDPEELVGRNAFELIHSEDREQVRRAWEARPGEVGFVNMVEYRCRHADGSWRYLESSGRRPPEGSEFEGVLVHSRDVTERKELEERLQETRRMETVSRLVSGIAHDFNNLLTVITCDTDILLHDLDEDDPRRAEVTEIRDAAERAGRLTHDLLAFARQESLRLREIDLVRAFRDLTPMVSEELGEEVDFELEANCDEAWVRVDPALARQVLFELVSNARDAMPEGGTFRIEVRCVRIERGDPVTRRGIQPGSWIAVSYADTGEGMSEDARRRVFEPFFSTKERSSGLGLSSVHGLVKQSEGEVWIESAPGKGTTVWTYLPDVGRPPGYTPPSEGPETEGSKGPTG
ncbi:MAG: PAS domain S-box protein [Longimicrobiales bacterium]